MIYKKDFLLKKNKEKNKKKQTTPTNKYTLNYFFDKKFIFF